MPRRFGSAVLAPLAVALVSLPSGSAHAQLAAGDPDMKFEMVTHVMGLSNPTDIAFLPDGRQVITQKGGLVVVRRADGTLVRATAPHFVITNPGANEQGLLGVVADPSVGQNKTFYFYASIGTDVANRHKVMKGVLADDNTFTIDPRPIIDQGLEGPANHDGGGLIVHKNQLYVSVGDTGANATPPANKYSSCLNKPNGKILRVGLDGSVPADNPLVGLTAVTGCTTATRATGGFSMQPPDTRIYSWGFRNPYRFWIDPRTDLLWIGDVGERTREEITLGGKGTHHGYPFFEGSVAYNQAFNTFGGCKGMTPGVDCTPTLFDYQNSGPMGDCVIGGLIPEGCGWPAEYTARYVFGDHGGGGKFWTLDVAPDRRGIVPNSLKDFGALRGLASFRMGHGDSLYLVSHDGGNIAKITPRNRPAACNVTTPPDAGAAGGAGGAAGTGGSGAGGRGGTGAGGTGGTAATGGAGGATGTGGRGGTGGTTGGAAGGAGGAAGASGGTGGIAGTSGTTGGTGGTGGSMDAAPGGGCGCAAAGEPSADALVLALGAFSALARRRRRRSA